MAQDKVKKENIEADKALDNMTTDPVTGQPGDLYGAPEKPSQMFLDDMKEKETGIPQDPELKGTGQPGELYGAPQTPSDEWLQEMEKQDVHDEARNEVATMLAPDFKGGWWMKSLDERFDFVKILN